MIQGHLGSLPMMWSR